MNGPPGKEEAARILDRSEAAENRNAARSLEGDDVERKRVLGELRKALCFVKAPR